MGGRPPPPWGRRCNITARNNGGSSPPLSVAVTTLPDASALPSAPPAPEVQDPVAASETGAVLTVGVDPSADSLYVVCSGVASSDQYNYTFTDGAVILSVSGLSPASNHT